MKNKGKKQVDLKLKEQTKPIEGKSNNQSKIETIFDDLISKKKKDSMNEFYEFYLNNFLMQ